MLAFAAPYLLLLAVISTQGPLPRVTHAEGPVSADASGVRTSGRAEIALPDGSLVHMDARTIVRFPTDAALAVDDGRIVMRAITDVEVATPNARLIFDAGTVAIVLVDARSGRLLVNVPQGAVTMRTRYAAITRVITGQSAMMTSATAVPWATAYSRVQLDAFTLWSDARAASIGRADWAASDISGAYVGSTPPCTGYPSWTAPCWVLPLPAQPGQGPAPPPSYAPNYAPNYGPNYTPDYSGTPPTVAPSPSTGPRGPHESPPPATSPSPPGTAPAAQPASPPPPPTAAPPAKPRRGARPPERPPSS
jgi:hypothetical protein